MTGYAKQLPDIDGSTKPYWDAARRHELLAYRCLNCGTFYSQVTLCLACHKPRMDWVKVSGKGYVYTYSVYHKVYDPAWANDIPYNVAWVKLDEGPLLVTNIVGCRNDQISTGMPVEVVFEDVTDEVTLPKFRPVAAVSG
jgi:uncharacterized OB-fold protein